MTGFDTNFFRDEKLPQIGRHRELRAALQQRRDNERTLDRNLAQVRDEKLAALQRHAQNHVTNLAVNYRRGGLFDFFCRVPDGFDNLKLAAGTRQLVDYHQQYMNLMHELHGAGDCDVLNGFSSDFDGHVLLTVREALDRGASIIRSSRTTLENMANRTPAQDQELAALRAAEAAVEHAFPTPPPPPSPPAREQATQTTETETGAGTSSSINDEAEESGGEIIVQQHKAEYAKTKVNANAPGGAVPRRVQGGWQIPLACSTAGVAVVALAIVATWLGILRARANKAVAFGQGPMLMPLSQPMGGIPMGGGLGGIPMNPVVNPLGPPVRLATPPPAYVPAGAMPPPQGYMPGAMAAPMPMPVGMPYPRQPQGALYPAAVANPAGYGYMQPYFPGIQSLNAIG